MKEALIAIGICVLIIFAGVFYNEIALQIVLEKECGCGHEWDISNGITYCKKCP